MKERSAEEMVRGMEMEEEEQRGDEREESKQVEGEVESDSSQGRVDKEESVERNENEGKETDGDRAVRARASTKRARAGPTFTDNQDILIVNCVKDHPEIYAKEHIHYVEKVRKDSL